MLLGVASLPAEPDLWQHLPLGSLLTPHRDHDASHKDAVSPQLAAKGSASPAQLLLTLLARTAAQSENQFGRVKATFI